MVNFLDKIISVLPEVQKLAIKNLIASKVNSGDLQSVRSRQEDTATIYNRIKSKLGTLLLSPIYVSPDDKISSADYNKVMEDIYLDLNALYSNINSFSSIVNKQAITLDSEYNKSRASIEKLLNDVAVFILRKKSPEFNEVKLIDFNVATNYSKKQPIAEVNPEIRLLELKPAYNSRVQLLNRAARTTKIYTKTYSQGLKGDLGANFSVDNIVDQRPETFWASLILADSPVNQIYEKNTTTGDLYQVSINGPVIEVYFRFSHAEKINTIRVAPFSEFPVSIIDVSYRSSASSLIFTPIDDFTTSTTLDWEEYNFSPILAHEIRISISQENYKKLSYMLPKSVIINTDIFQRILKQRAKEIIGNNVFDSDFSLYTVRSLSSYDDAIKALEDLYVSSGVDLTVQPDISYIEQVENILTKIYSDISSDELNNIVSYFGSQEVNQQPGSPTVNITKYEYLLGLREVEIGYQIYYPTSYYESEKFSTQATVSEIQIEVDERHTSFVTPWEDDYRKTSTEWDVDIGNGRKIPIHPRNIVDGIDGIPAVKDERINFDLISNKAYTRMGAYYSTPYRVKKNGELLTPDQYQVSRITGSIPRLELILTGTSFDSTSIYTIDYAVDPSSYSIDVLTSFSSEQVPSPEKFTSVGSNNEIVLTKFPFINYEIINSTGIFSKNSTVSSWTFIPPEDNISTGQILIYPTITDNIGNILQVGNITGYMITGTWGIQSGNIPIDLTTLSNNYFGSINGIQYGYFIKPMDSTNYGEVDSFTSTREFILKEPIQVTQSQVTIWDAFDTGKVFSGQITGTASGYLRIDYTLGVGVVTDNQVYAISDLSYVPMEVTVGGKIANNITDYETLVHPAFSIANNKDAEYQYIQAGKTLYFNQKIDDTDIRVDYRWITEYLKVLGTLYCNTPINPDLTPKVNQIRIYTNNLII